MGWGKPGGPSESLPAIWATHEKIINKQITKKDYRIPTRVPSLCLVVTPSGGMFNSVDAVLEEMWSNGLGAECPPSCGKP